MLKKFSDQDKHYCDRVMNLEDRDVAASGSAAELLYLSEELSTLGFVCSKDLSST